MGHFVPWDVLSKGRFVCAPGNGDVVVELFTNTGNIKFFDSETARALYSVQKSVKGISKSG